MMTAVIRSAFAVVLLAAAGAAAGAPAAHAQDGALDRVHNLIATGRFTEAGNTLERWERDFADPRSAATPSDRARALYLRGLLSTDAQAAEDAFVAVVLTYPSASVAPEALLRLGQGLLTRGEPRRAVAYLERLRSDYPGSPQRETGWLWLARAQLAAGSSAAACATARAGVAAASAPHLRTLIEMEQDRACGTASVPAAEQAVPPPTAPAPPRQLLPPPAQARGATQAQHAGDFALQTGAYRELRSAQTIADQMRARGLDVRVVLVGDSPLYRVRFGSFATSAEAADASRAIRSAGFTVIIVDDVRLERR